MLQQNFKRTYSLLALVFITLLTLAGCQSKPQGLTAEQIALLQAQGFKLTDNGWEFGFSDKVLFGNNVGKLSPQSTEIVEKMGKALKSVNIVQFRLDGHTDNYGEDSYNDQLSLRRANAVADVLAGVGIPRANIETRGIGKRQPVASNATSSGRAENRRVAIVVTP
ncbi:OmpA family protein [Serratia fonticola]|uniref:OmpA family protein n=1 Tax=Serratia fonticola TaxID=47917 RepID=A0ABY9PPX2_SERFO|nr:OmpA family protein [Serratia fonticola]WMT15471.1 OmpA family protein [Serratia fonticola]